MSLVGPRPKSVLTLPPRPKPAVRIPPLPHRCRCNATLKTQADYVLHNCFTKQDRLGDRRTRCAL